MHPTTLAIADPTVVEHVLPLLLGGTAAAGLLQMAFAASELAIADVKLSHDLSGL